ncbi:MAG: macro domain-containing protein [Lachnospiraceae bacterium]|nr:macro domain-containing protein [Lachnospiraceae bacterium]MCM1232422.1 macro domain-containing protein [Ruminococcus flavefaciens]
MREIVGDILTPANFGTSVVVCHQVNCMGVMGAGLAKQIKDKFPKVFRMYRAQCSAWRHNPGGNLGYAQFCSVENSAGYIVANIFSQLSYGRNGRQTDYDAVRDGFRRVATAFPDSTIRIPYEMGCGLGGGDWNIVLCIVQDTLVSKGIDVEIWKLNQREDEYDG